MAFDGFTAKILYHPFRKNSGVGAEFAKTADKIAILSI
jgi:hypothetical protein